MGIYVYICVFIYVYIWLYLYLFTYIYLPGTKNTKDLDMLNHPTINFYMHRPLWSGNGTSIPTHYPPPNTTAPTKVEKLKGDLPGTPKDMGPQ